MTSWRHLTLLNVAFEEIGSLLKARNLGTEQGLTEEVINDIV